MTAHNHDKNTKTGADIHPLFMDALDTKAIAQALDNTLACGCVSEVEVTREGRHTFRVLRSNPLQEFLVEVKIK